MRDDHKPDEGMDTSDAEKMALKLRQKLGYDAMTALFESLTKDPETQSRLGNRSQFDGAVRHIAFDMVTEDPNILNLDRSAQISRLQTKLDLYVTDAAYRTRFAGKARG